MSEQDQFETAPAYTVSVKLTPIAIEVLEQLFILGPTWDGNVVSKSGRDELADLKLIGRCEGYQFLLLAGMRLALANGLDRKKETRGRRQREQLGKLSQIEEIISPTNQQQASNVMGLTPSRQPPTVEGLERLLRPEPQA